MALDVTKIKTEADFSSLSEDDKLTFLKEKIKADFNKADKAAAQVAFYSDRTTAIKSLQNKHESDMKKLIDSWQSIENTAKETGNWSNRPQ